MRRKRLKRKNERRRKFVNTVILLSFSILGIAQTTSSTYALFRDQTQIEVRTFSSAFVFPKTVEEVEERAKKARQEAIRFREQANEYLKACTGQEISSQTAYLLRDKAKQEAKAARFAANQALSFSIQLRDFMNQAQTNVNAEKMAQVREKLRSAERVNSYIVPAFENAQRAAKEADQAAIETEQIINVIGECAAEKEKKEKEAILTDEEKPEGGVHYENKEADK